MGCGPSAPVDKEEAEKNRVINKLLQEDKRRLENEVKLLLLGAGESGKSTIAKQMKIIHLKGFTDEERSAYKTIIYNNVISSMRSLCQACYDLNIDVNPGSKTAYDKMFESDEYINGGDLTQDLAQTIKTLWADGGIKESYSRSAEFQLNDSSGYYFNKIDELVKHDYSPSEQDVLRSRAKTTGIIETEFTIDTTKFKMVDVGGQRSERKKWMHCFQDVTSVIFCVAMSEYNLKMYEDDKTNRMHDSLDLFHQICNNRWFVNTAIILFLNKRDLFAEKIQQVDLNVCFPEYKGGRDNTTASAFIKEKFLSQNEQPKKIIYPHITCATDTKNIEHVFNAVSHIFLGQVLENSGLGI
eukprot:TRINITY_DN1167_c0_g1_i1.p1 TRINITY_DN1167_c0_g1~~TRINITY_DN1167_c0_g1_i1.p1  ORF type:complete len:355 (-),score=57.67 TRINITY_DN1167_c0_g1_i1:147-1211(-)